MVYNGQTRYVFTIPNFPINIFVNDVYQYTTRRGHGFELRTVENIKSGDRVKFKRAGLLNISLETISEVTIGWSDLQYALDFVNIEGKVMQGYWEQWYELDSSFKKCLLKSKD